MQRLCFLPLLPKCTPTSTPTLLPSGDTRPYYVHFLGENIPSLFNVSSTFILGCIPEPSWLRLISAGWHRSLWALLSLYLTTWTQCDCWLGVYLANTEQPYCADVLSSGDTACVCMEYACKPAAQSKNISREWKWNNVIETDGRWKREIGALQPTPITVSFGWVSGTVAPEVGVLEAHLLCNTFSLLHTNAKLCYNKVESQQLSSSSVGYFKFFMLFSCFPLSPLPHYYTVKSQHSY